MPTDTNRGCQSKIKNRMADSVDPDEMAHYEQSHLDLHCLHRYWFWSAGLKGFIQSFFWHIRKKHLIFTVG